MPPPWPAFRILVPENNVPDPIENPCWAHTWAECSGVRGGKHMSIVFSFVVGNKEAGGERNIEFILDLDLDSTFWIYALGI